MIRPAEVSKAEDDSLTQRIRDVLSGIDGVVERRMFGGTTFLVSGKMCVSAGRERIMCRIDPKTQSAALTRSGCSLVEMRGRKIKGYIYVATVALSSKKGLEYWIRTALAYNEKLTAAPRRLKFASSVSD